MSLLDEHTATFGIRSLSLDPQRGLRINGEPVDLRGPCVHHDNGPLGAATIDRADERRVELLKSAGFNAIRSAHNPMSNAMLDACDRLGMIVMDETFDMWHESKSGDDYGLRFAEWWEADVEAMVRNDINHPSVVFYSIGNEIADGSTPTGYPGGTGARRQGAFARRHALRHPSRSAGLMVGGADLFADIRKTFADRAVDETSGVNTAATSLADVMSEAMKSPVVADKVDEAFSHLDAAGYNYMAARFEMDGASYPNRVMYGSETHPAKIGSEWPLVTGNPFVIGDFTWTGWDYLGEAGIGRVEYADEQPERPMSTFQGAYPWLTGWCGDIDITGVRRPQSYYREIVYGLRSDPYIAVIRPERGRQFLSHASPWSWSDAVSSWSWPGFDGEPVAVEVYADADEVELLVNGSSVGKRPVTIDQEYRDHVRRAVRARCDRGDRPSRGYGDRPVLTHDGRRDDGARRPRRSRRDPRRRIRSVVRRVDPRRCGRGRAHHPRSSGHDRDRWSRSAPRSVQCEPGDRREVHGHRLLDLRRSCPCRGPSHGRGTDHRHRHCRWLRSRQRHHHHHMTSD